MARPGHRVYKKSQPQEDRKRNGTLPAFVRDRIMREDITPLEVLVENMRHFWNLAMKWESAGNDSKELRGIAAEFAVSAAPYLHPKLAAVDMTHSGEVEIKSVVSEEPLTQEEWLELYGQKETAH